MTVLNVDEKLRGAGVEQIKFYYKNYPLIGNIFSVCLFLSKDKKIISRGVSICSVKDSHDKKFARRKCKSRAYEAIFSENNKYQIGPDLYNDPRFHLINPRSFKFKDEKELDKFISYADKLNLEWNSNAEKFIVQIPYLYSVEVSQQFFNFKSEFQPIPTSEEKRMFKTLKIN